jgi:ABC-2 type transport system ATP-binding protein
MSSLPWAIVHAAIFAASLAAVARHRHGGRVVLVVVLLGGLAAFVLVRFQRRRERPRSGPAQPPPAVPTSDEPSHQPPDRTPPSGNLPSPRARRYDTSEIELEGLTKRFGQKLAVDKLSFAVRPGHVTGFLGPNGAGKSTTLRLIMGLDLPTNGSALIGGRPYRTLRWPLHEVGALLEANAIHPGRSAHAHLWMLARTHRIPRRRVDEVLHLVGLASVARQQAGQFSLGMTQRLGIAAALLGDPGVLIFDEPLNGLDTDGIRWVRSLLRGLADEGRTVFVSSHLMSEMALMADHVVVIGRGRLIADQPMAEFTSGHARQVVRVRSPDLERLLPALVSAGATAVRQDDGSAFVSGIAEERVGEIAWRASICLYELAPQSASLEEAFVQSTEGDVEYRGDAPYPARPTTERSE